MNRHHSKSAQDGIRPSNMSTDPPEALVVRVAPVLTLVLHSVHPVAILLVKEIHQLVVEEAFPTVTSAERHNPPHPLGELGGFPAPPSPPSPPGPLVALTSPTSSSSE